MINWMFFKKGAEFLSQHPGLITFNTFGTHKDITSVPYIKLFFPVALLGTIVGMIMMWNFPGI